MESLAQTHRVWRKRGCSGDAWLVLAPWCSLGRRSAKQREFKEEQRNNDKRLGKHNPQGEAGGAAVV